MNREKTNYFKLIQLLISNNRTLIWLFQIVVVIGITFLFTITSLSGTIIRSKQDIAVRSCGKFLMVMSDVDETLIKDIKEKNGQFRFASFQIGGNAEYAGNKITYGAMDEKLGDKLAIQLLKGRWPKASDQIVVEEYVAYMFEIQHKKLPYNVTFLQDGRKVSCKVTGIISNYSHTLTDYYDSTLNTKAYPSIIFQKGQLEEAKTSLVISQKKLDFKNCSDDCDSILMKEYKETINVGNTCVNDKLEFYAYESIQDIIEMEEIYRVLLNALLIMAFVVIIRVIMAKNKKTLYLFESMGLTVKEKQKVIFYLIALITTVGFAVGGGLSLLAGLLYRNKAFLGYSDYYYSVLKKNAAIECVIIAVVLMMAFIGYQRNWKESIAQGMKVERENFTKKKYKFRKIDFNVVFMQAVCLFFIIASINFADMFHFQKDEFKFGLYSKQLANMIELKQFDIVKYTDEYFPFDSIHAFKKFENDITLEMAAETKESALLFLKDQIDAYFEEYCAEDDSKLSGDKKYMWNQVSDEADKYKVIKADSLKITVLPQKEFLHFMQNNGIQNSALETNQEKACVLVLPDYKPVESNTSLGKDRKIMLGRIEKDKGKLILLKETFKVEEMLSCSSEESQQIQIVMSEAVAQMSKIVLGYDVINIVMKPDTKESIQRAMDQKISLLMASVQGGKLDSSIIRNQENKLMGEYSAMLSNSLIFFCVLTICIYILINSYLEWEKNKFEYGVLRSFGMSYSRLQRKLFIRYSISNIIAGIIAVFIGNYAFYDGTNIIWKLFVSMAITFSITYLCRIIIYYTNKNRSISTMLNMN